MVSGNNHNNNNDYDNNNNCVKRSSNVRGGFYVPCEVNERLLVGRRRYL